jgi:hypothetical protein
MLAELGQTGLPGAEADLSAWSESDRRERDRARALADPVPRSAALRALAEKRRDSKLALHEAMIALLLAGDPQGSLDLAANIRVEDLPDLTRLARAEALRRTGALAEADAELTRLSSRVQEAPVTLALVAARLQASRGDFARALSVLEAALKVHSDDDALQAFADSARELIEPTAIAEVEGLQKFAPLGLRVLSDLPEGLLRTLFLRLGPYVREIGRWLPALRQPLDGVLAIHGAPASYLRAALLPAGESLDNVAGMFVRAGMGGKPTILACRAWGEDELVRNLAHELWHLALASTGVQVPAWLDEGMAVHISSGTPESNRLLFDQRPVEFEAVSDVPGLLRRERLDQVLGASRARFHAQPAVSANYFAGWAMTRWLVDNDHRAVTAMLTGKPVPKGLAEGWEKVLAHLRLAGLAR